jgi:hypothetical protein
LGPPPRPPRRAKKDHRRPSKCRACSRTRARHSNAETAETGQTAHIPDNAFDRRQKWTPHVCSRVFRRAGLYPKSPANSLTRTQAAEPSVTSIGEATHGPPLSHGTRRGAWRRNLREDQASWCSGARRDNVTPASQPSSHSASRLKSCDLRGVPMTAARWCRDAALGECLSVLFRLLRRPPVGPRWLAPVSPRFGWRARLSGLCW